MELSEKERQELIYDLQEQIQNCNSGPDEVSWGYEDGILISKNKAQYLLSLLSKEPAPEVSADRLLTDDSDIDTVGKCANCGVEFHIHKTKRVEGFGEKEARKFHYEWLKNKGCKHTPAHFLAYSTTGDTHKILESFASQSTATLRERIRKLEAKLIWINSRLKHIERSFLTHPDCQKNSEFEDRANELWEMSESIKTLLNSKP